MYMMIACVGVGTKRTFGENWGVWGLAPSGGDERGASPPQTKKGSHFSS